MIIEALIIAAVLKAGKAILESETRADDKRRAGSGVAPSERSAVDRSGEESKLS